jgi:hypothetical protein
MHAEEQSQVADADAQAADWAREAQRDLVGGGIISREQVSEEISEADLEFSEDELAQADELRSLDEDADVPSPDVLAAMTGGTPVSRRQQTVVHDESAVDKNMRARFLSIARAQQIASSPVPGRPDIPIGGGQSRDWSDERGLTQAEAQLAQLQRSVDADRQPVEPTQNGKLSADQIRSLLSQSEQAEDNMVSFSGEETEFQAKRAPEEDSLDDGAAPSDDMAAHLRGLGKQHERDEFKSMAARAMMARSMADFDRVMLPSPAPAAAPTQPEQPVEPLPIETQPPVSPSRKPRLPIPSKFSAIKTWPRTSAHKRPL